jgi:PEP-CTERM motif
MRAAIVLIALSTVMLATKRADAGTYTLDFSSLAPDLGQEVLEVEIVFGPFTAYIYHALVVAPAGTGQIGILFDPTGGLTVTLTNGSFGIPFSLDGVSATYAGEASSFLHEDVVVNNGVVEQTWAMTISGIQTETFTPTPEPISVTEAGINPYPNDEGRLLSFTIDSTIPEPSSFSMLSIGLVGLAAAGAYRRRLRQPTA